MTLEQKIATVKVLIVEENASDSTIKIYLDVAGNKIIQRLYPHKIPEYAVVPEYLGMMQCELASRLYLRIGAEGETSHSENGISRTYDSADDEDILNRIVPFVKI